MSNKLIYSYKQKKENKEYEIKTEELNSRDLVFLRAGLPSYYKEDTVEGPSFGFGLNYFLNRTNTLLIIDYSLSDFGSLGGVKRLNIGFNF